MDPELAAYHEICCDTMGRGDVAFVHQHVVDAFAAQTATPEDRPIRLAFALIGLALHLDHGFTGRQVQLAHMALARRQRDWPRFPLPADRGQIRATTVRAARPGSERDALIEAWADSVWASFHAARPTITALLHQGGYHWS